ncbi:DUF3120 domain-containing protein [Microcoleus sp. FACHB-68]|uniref:DUF3120 domain-containing protein n=1 Tax=Microcoleus sp. FACHB-68 TaxID=2692826 RepID=UPI00168973EE|nr:DUF3120 domain-containing protein [Microcoleus sp. FACHB-68]MBD1938583.1 DUF3120 domain-containing protein [Microcoleus sp. FACHB-68]
MFNETLSSYTSNPQPAEPTSNFSHAFLWKITLSESWRIFAAAIFLVSVPVFFQAPLVRQFPLLSLALTGCLVWLGWRLLSNSSTHVWGDLLLGFTGSWLAGSIYWGWLRWEPVLHLPVEAICLPVALWCITRRRLQVGSWFYLGSLLGTAITDIYFYLVDLIPHWRQIMQVDPALALPIFQSATKQVQTPWGIGWAMVLLVVLLVAGVVPLRSKQLHWWAFGGAVLSTILVDSLFWFAASAA